MKLTEIVGVDELSGVIFEENSDYFLFKVRSEALHSESYFGFAWNGYHDLLALPVFGMGHFLRRIDAQDAWFAHWEAPSKHEE